MQVGRYEVSVHNHGFFRLDGGAMFGAVPKVLWEKGAPADEQNRILLATRSLIIEDGDRKMIVDLGCGDKWDEKSRAIFCISDEPYVPVPWVTDVLLTHMHFDHAGGVSRIRSSELGAGNPEASSMRPHPPSDSSPQPLEDTPNATPSRSPSRVGSIAGEESVEPCYPNARHYLSAENYENAKRPNVRERASYLAGNVAALEKVNLTLTSDGQEIWPGLTVHRSDGHTRGLQWVRLQDGGATVAFPTDLFPTSKHLPLPYAMGYDMCADTVIREKGAFLGQAVDGDWVVVFEHDPEIGAARLEFDARGRAQIREVLDLAGL